MICGPFEYSSNFQVSGHSCQWFDDTDKVMSHLIVVQLWCVVANLVMSPLVLIILCPETWKSDEYPYPMSQMLGTNYKISALSFQQTPQHIAISSTPKAKDLARDQSPWPTSFNALHRHYFWQAPETTVAAGAQFVRLFSINPAASHNL